MPMKINRACALPARVKVELCAYAYAMVVEALNGLFTRTTRKKLSCNLTTIFVEIINQTTDEWI